jgi:hypothetical protein
MDSPLASKPILPGLVSPRVEGSSPDRKRKGRSFQDELAAGGGRPKEHGHPPAPGPTPPGGPTRPHAITPPEDEAGHLLDVEA